MKYIIYVNYKIHKAYGLGSVVTFKNRYVITSYSIHYTKLYDYPISYNELNIREFSTVFEECNIDLVLSGHDHIYSRTTMHNNNQVETNNGSTYVVGGSASGSKYYKEKAIDGGRYWEHIIRNNFV